MNKATVITDAIAYIEKLQKSVRDLSNQLFEMEATCEEQLETPMNSAEEMKTWGIEVKRHILELFFVFFVFLETQTMSTSPIDMDSISSSILMQNDFLKI